MYISSSSQNGNFDSDLIEGKRYEQITFDLLNSKNYFPKFNTSLDINVLKKYDISFDNGCGNTQFLEVKKDRQTDSTGNICIEYSCSGKPSGLKTTTATQWFIYSDTKVYILNVKALKTFLNNDFNRFKYAKYLSGVTRKSKCFLIKAEVLLNFKIASVYPYVKNENIITFFANNLEHNINITL